MLARRCHQYLQCRSNVAHILCWLANAHDHFRSANTRRRKHGSSEAQCERAGLDVAWGFRPRQELEFCHQVRDGVQGARKPLDNIAYFSLLPDDTGVSFRNSIFLSTTLQGTKLACAEGGCGACAVQVTNYNMATGLVRDEPVSESKSLFASGGVTDSV